MDISKIMLNILQNHLSFGNVIIEEISFLDTDKLRLSKEIYVLLH